jgi:UDPglucose 6-dehydrogenase
LIDDYTLVVTKSTVPVGTGEKVRAAVQKSLDKRGVDVEFGIASNPEFLKEGAAVSDFLKPDRIVVGIDSDRAKKLMNRLYKPFVMNGHPVIFMDVASAEMTKYAANSMLATKISFMNDISNLCEIVGADVNLVRQGIGSDTRIGTKFIYPGIGYGGSCFPKDVKALIKTATQHNYSMSVLKAVEEVNERQKNILYQKVEDYFGGKDNLLGRKVALWGLSFKPETDDMREAPSLTIVKQLLDAGCIVSAYDPVSTDEAKHLIGDTIEYCPDQYSALMDADCLMILTEWSEFKFPNFNTVSNLMSDKIIFDGRNIYDYQDMIDLGFTYTCMGVDTKSTHPKKKQVEVA